jgi:ATP-dependent RNA helicase DHX57
VNMLSEHCQKQKWDRPDYSMMRTPEGFVSTVTLSSKNPKTGEVTTLPPFRVPHAYRELAAQPTAVEARHFAAAYTLFRVASGKNLAIAMPPTYKDLWKGAFADIKKTEEAEGRGWMFEADPFKTAVEREAEKIAAEKRKEELEKQRAKEKAQPIAIRDGKDQGWKRAPKVEMGKRMRVEVERLIRKGVVWNPHAIKINETAKAAVIKEVAKLGFKTLHIEEAIEHCKDEEEVLEWLLIHVPEDDLPRWALPENYTAGISMASGNLVREAALKRLAAAGYAFEMCEEALDENNGLETRAAETLQSKLLNLTDQDSISSDVANHSIEDRGIDDEWTEEQAVVKSIYGERYSSRSANTCQIQLEITTDAGDPIYVQFQKPSTGYPNSLPIMFVNAKLPAYVRLSIARQALLYCKQNLLGQQVIFNLVDWVEQEIPNIIQNPGKLADVSSAVGGEDKDSKETQLYPRRKQRFNIKPVNLQPGSEKSVALLTQWQNNQQTPTQQKMLKARQSLPSWKLRDTIVHSVNTHQVVIISGETGSGKSTQSVQFILDDMIQRELGEAANIICTQPRRISALGLADRVADERCSRVGDEVGYTIRGESKSTPGVTKITFVTTGVLLRRLQMSGGTADDVLTALADVSHVVVDEVHERSLDTDFLLVLLKDTLKRRKDLKVVLMSATLDAEVFVKYFKDVGPVGKVEIQGRTHPVEDIYLDDIMFMNNWDERFDDDEGSFEAYESAKRSGGKVPPRAGARINYDLIADTVRNIDAELGSQPGGILIFLPGTMEIDRTIQAVKNISNIYALPLHASLLPAEQRRVFPPAPHGMRKVIVATNVAETSITIEDIVAVIDTGRVKETSFDPQNNMVRLEEVWASRAACKQRRGRAGRVRAGKCYKLYTKMAELNEMPDRPDPEIRRVPLEQLCLSVRAMGVKDIQSFLAGALTPPDSMAVGGAIELLQRIGALEGDELTALGSHLAMIPADLRCGKLLVYGALFGCLEACLTIASILTVRSPFVAPKDKRDESRASRTSFAQGHGDLVADLQAYEQWALLRSKGLPARELRSWCDINFLSTQTLFDISSNRLQYLSSLKETGFVPLVYSATTTSFNQNSTNTALIRALVAGSFNPQICRIEFPLTKYAASSSGTVALDPEARTIKYFNETNGRVFLHPSSTLFDAQSFPSNAAFMSYFSKIATSKIFIKECTPFNAYTALMFCGAVTVDKEGRGILVDGWLKVNGWARIGVLISRLRGMLDAALARRIERPGGNVGPLEENIVRVVRRLVELNGLDD